MSKFKASFALVAFCASLVLPQASFAREARDCPALEYFACGGGWSCAGINIRFHWCRFWLDQGGA